MVPLQKGDVVTRYVGTITETEPSDRSYGISFVTQELFLDGIRVPRKGQGLGSFVNRESRAAGLKRKNCDIVKVGMKHYVEMCKDVSPGDELYTTYGKRYRI